MFSAAAETFRRHTDKIVSERDAAQTGGEWPNGFRRLAFDSARDLFRQFLPVASIQRETSLGRIGQETALHQDRWNGRAPQNIKTAPANPAIFGRRAGDNVAMNTLGEARAVAPIIISLDPVRPGTRSRIEMDRNKRRAAIRVRDRDPRA